MPTIGTGQNTYLKKEGLAFRTGTTDTASLLYDDATDKVNMSGIFNLSGSLSISGNPVMTGDSGYDSDTLQTVTDRGATTTTNIVSTGPHISGATGLFGAAVISNFNASDYAAFGHEDAADNSFAIRQHSNSNTYVNCGSSRNLDFRHANSTQGGFTAASDFFVGPISTDNTLFVDVSEEMVGIGTYSPNRKLNIVGTATTDGIGVGTPTSPNGLELTSNGANYEAYVLGHSFLAFGTNHLNVGTSASERMRILSNGYVGIGTNATPSQSQDSSGTRALFQSSGDIYVGNNLVASDGRNFQAFSAGFGVVQNSLSTIMAKSAKAHNTENNKLTTTPYSTDGVLFYSQNYSRGHTWHRTTGYAQGISISDSEGELMRLTTGGNVGIGTDDPSNKLEIDGGISITSGDGSGPIGTNGLHLMFDEDANKSWIRSENNGSTNRPLYFGGNPYHFLYGNVGIGTNGNYPVGTAPAAKLDIRGTTDGQLLLDTDGGSSDIKSSYNLELWADYDSNNSAAFKNILFKTDGDNTRLFISGDGKVGVGTTRPTNNFHVRSESDGDWVTRISNTEATAGRSYGLKVDGGSNSADISFEVANYAGDVLQRIEGGGNVGINTASPEEKLHVGGDIRVGTGAPADFNRVEFTRYGGALVGGIGWHSDSIFYVAGHPEFGPTAGNDVRVYGFGGDLHLGDNTNGDVLTIDYTNGNVGIGIADPSKKLTVISDDDAGTTEIIAAYSNDEAQHTSLGYNSLVGSYSLDLFTLTSQPIRFRPNSTERMRITNDGSVGIGAITPLATLDVRGDISGSGSFLGTGAGNRITNNNVPYLLSGDAAAALTLQDVCDNGSTTTTSVTISDDLAVDTDTLFVDASTDKVGIGTDDPQTTLDLRGDFKQGRVLFRKAQLVTFDNTVANQKVDIYWTGTQQFWGQIKITLTAGYSNQNSTGIVKKQFLIGVNASNSIFTNDSRIVEADGDMPDNFTISDLRWDASNSRYYITIVHRVSTGNQIGVKIEAFSHREEDIDNFDDVTIGSIYTTDTTAYAKPSVYYNNNVGIGTTNPSEAKLDIRGGNEQHLYIQGANDSVAALARIKTVAGGSVLLLETATVSDSRDILKAKNSNGTVFNLQADGKVGIGTEVPAARLEIYENGGGSTTDLLNVGGTGNGRMIVRHIDGKSASSASAQALFLNYGTSNDVSIAHGGGDVGVGTISPSYKLDVKGDRILLDRGGTNDAVIEARTSTAGAYFIANSLGTGNYAGLQIQGAGADNWFVGQYGYADFRIVDGARSGGTAALTIQNSTQNVGIGETDPEVKLEVAGDIMAKDGFVSVGMDPSHGYQFHDLGTGWGFKTLLSSTRLAMQVQGIESMTWESNGRVGIGSSDPQVHKLEVGGAISGHQIISPSGTFTRADIGSVEIFGSAVYTDTIRVTNIQDKASNGNAEIVFGGSNKTIDFETDTTSRMFIDSLGKVGIGTHVPSRLLTLYNNTATVTNNSQLRIDNAGAGDAYIYMYAGTDWSFGIDNSDADAFKICPSNDVSDGTEVVNIERDGKVGIGTNPRVALDVNGEIRNLAKVSRNYRVNMGTTTLYVGTVDLTGNGDSAGCRIKIYDGAEKVWRLLHVTVQNSGGTNYTSVTVEGGGEDTEVHIDLLYKNRDGDATKTDFFLDPTASKSFTQYVYVEGYIITDTGYNDTSATSVDLDVEVALYQTDAADGSNVGIGTVNPLAKLHVSGSVMVDSDQGNGGLYITRQAYLNEALKISTNDEGSYFTIIQDESSAGFGKMVFQADADHDHGYFGYEIGGFERMRLNVTGLGIGVTDPDQKLDVNGNIRIPNQGKIVFGSAGATPDDYLQLYDVGAGTELLKLVQDTATRFSVEGVNGNVYMQGDVGIGTDTPQDKLHVAGGGDGQAMGGKDITLTTSFADAITVTLGNHQGCYIKATLFGDWSSHSTIAYMAEFFIQNGGGGYMEPGTIIRQVDNTHGVDGVEAKIVDSSTDAFVIQFKLNQSLGGTTAPAKLNYHIMGQFDSIS